MWKCTKCHEPLEDGFEVCWKCGTASDGTKNLFFESQAADPRAGLRNPSAERTPPRQCPQCDLPMQRIKLIDKTGESSYHADLEYTGHDADRSFWLGRFPVKGKVVASMCDHCGRIVLHGVPFSDD